MRGRVRRPGNGGDQTAACTATGDQRCVVSPRPSSLQPLSPQAQRLPSLLRARVVEGAASHRHPATVSADPGRTAALRGVAQAELALVVVAPSVKAAVALDGHGVVFAAGHRRPVAVSTDLGRAVPVSRVTETELTPRVLAPGQRLPSLLVARLHASPQATDTQVLPVPTRVGLTLAVVSPRPSWPW